jgi:hypothetical protein
MNTNRHECGGAATARTALGPRAQQVETAMVLDGSWAAFRRVRAASRDGSRSASVAAQRAIPTSDSCQLVSIRG